MSVWTQPVGGSPTDSRTSTDSSFLGGTPNVSVPFRTVSDARLQPIPVEPRERSIDTIAHNNYDAVNMNGSRLGEFETLLLLALARVGDGAHGAMIRREILDRTGRSASAGAIYTGLERLSRRGLISSRLGEATAERGGKRKRLYRLEEEGLAALRDTQRILKRMTEGLERMLET